MMRSEINNFLINEKICMVAMVAWSKLQDAWNGKSTTVTVDFGHAFPRKPSVVAFLSYVNGQKLLKFYSRAEVHKVTKTSADLYINCSYQCYVGWMACL